MKKINDLEFIEKTCTETINYFLSRKKTNTQTVCLGLIQRLRDCSLALQLLIGNFDVTPSLEYSAGIILRSAVLDSFLAFKMFKIIRDTKPFESDLAIFSDRVLSDGLRHTVKYIRVARDNNLILKTKEDFNQTLANFVNDYKDFFEPYKNDGTDPKVLASEIRTEELLKDAMAIDDTKTHVFNMWDAYQMYSKVDHFGIQYFKVVEMSNTKPAVNILNRINILVSNNSLLHIVLQHTDLKDVFLGEKSALALKYYGEMDTKLD